MFLRSASLPNEERFIRDCATCIAEEKAAELDQRLDIIRDPLNFIPHVFTFFLADNAENYGLNYEQDYNRLLQRTLMDQVVRGLITQQDHTRITTYLSAELNNDLPPATANATPTLR